MYVGHIGRTDSSGHGVWPLDFLLSYMPTAEPCMAKYVAKAQKISSELANEIWKDRENLRRNFWTIDEAIDDAKEKGEAPVVFADISDNPGSGATGDGTHMLRRLLERKVEGVIIYDPETVEQASSSGVGTTLKIRLGERYARILPESRSIYGCDLFMGRCEDKRLSSSFIVLEQGRDSGRNPPFCSA